jgi:hypothetical protein
MHEMVLSVHTLRQRQGELLISIATVQRVFDVARDKDIW